MFEVCENPPPTPVIITPLVFSPLTKGEKRNVLWATPDLSGQAVAAEENYFIKSILLVSVLLLVCKE